jgi:hypothetical protein
LRALLGTDRGNTIGEDARFGGQDHPESHIRQQAWLLSLGDLSIGRIGCSNVSSTSHRGQETVARMARISVRFRALNRSVEEVFPLSYAV